MLSEGKGKPYKKETNSSPKPKTQKPFRRLTHYAVRQKFLCYFAKHVKERLFVIDDILGSIYPCAITIDKWINTHEFRFVLCSRHRKKQQSRCHKKKRHQKETRLFVVRYSPYSLVQGRTIHSPARVR
mmetsp:Transcript_47147/g.142754  ORF Transcript_47147/g.142754 Transcript_47147/m.142754 type:complete len:128 (+) Transcript_47147:1067-1450(+)